MKKKQKDASVEQEAAVADCRQNSYLIYSSFISTQADTQLTHRELHEEEY